MLNIKLRNTLLILLSVYGIGVSALQLTAPAGKVQANPLGASSTGADYRSASIADRLQWVSTALHITAQVHLTGQVTECLHKLSQLPEAQRQSLQFMTAWCVARASTSKYPGRLDRYLPGSILDFHSLGRDDALKNFFEI